MYACENERLFCVSQAQIVKKTAFMHFTTQTGLDIGVFMTQAIGLE